MDKVIYYQTTIAWKRTVAILDDENAAKIPAIMRRKTFSDPAKLASLTELGFTVRRKDDGFAHEYKPAPAAPAPAPRK